MITVLIVMTIGIGVGYLLRSNKKLLKWNSKVTLWVIFLLLFFMGLQVGNNQVIMQHIDTIGLRGLELATVTILGSVILSWVVYQLFFKQVNHEG